MLVKRLALAGGLLALFACSALADHRRGGCGDWRDGTRYSSYGDRYYRSVRYYPAYRPSYRYSRYDDCYRPYRCRSGLGIALIIRL